MNASTRGIILTKADRINRRIDEFAHMFLNMEHIVDSATISKKDFQEFLKSMHVIVTTELTEKGVERRWKKQ